MTIQWWLICDQAGVQRQVMTDGCDPAAAGEDMTNRTATKMDRRGDFTIEKPDLNRGVWCDDLEVLKPKLMACVDEQREQEQMKYLTIGSAKKMIYSQKSKEVDDYNSLTASALSAISEDGLRARFPAAMAEADLTHQSLASIIDRMATAAALSNAQIYKIEARAQWAKAQIKDAATGDAARAAASVDWNS